MFSEDNDNHGVIWAGIFALVVLVTATVVGFGIYTTIPAKPKVTDTAMATATTTIATMVAMPNGAENPTEPVAVIEAATISTPLKDNEPSVQVENGVVKFYFAVGKKDIATNANAALSDVVAAVKAGKKIAISGYHDATGNAIKNAQIAKERAQAVQAALKSLGVTDAQMELKKPTDAKAGAGTQARRVEVSIS